MTVRYQRGVGAKLAAAEQVETQRAQVDRIWRERLERADYAADRARCQYQLAEPENRLVVRQLERDLETAMVERQRLGEEYDRFLAVRPTPLLVGAPINAVTGMRHAPPS
jgi:hypothetical protein